MKHRHERTRAIAVSILMLGTALVTLPPVQADSATPGPPRAAATLVKTPIPAAAHPPVTQLVVRYAAGAKARAGETAPGSDAVSAARLGTTSPIAAGLTSVRLARPVSLDVAAEAARELSEDPRVEFAEPDLHVVPMSPSQPDDTYLPEQWPLSSAYGIRPTLGWTRSTGAGVVVAVLDTGITAHPELDGRTVPGYDMIVDPAVSNDGGGRDANPADPGDWTATSNSSWHGTHVAGTIGAASDNGSGIAGVAPDARVQAVRVLGTGGGYQSDVLAGMYWAAGLPVAGVPANANPAKVINMSLGSTAPAACSAGFQQAIDDVVAAGVTVVVAAGNSGDLAENYVPANCDQVVVVAATGPEGYSPDYSNYGAGVDLAAPGGDQINYPTTGGVLSTLNAGTQGPTTPSYRYYQGTSMATPHVAGAAALLLAASPGLTPAQVEQRLKDTAYNTGRCPAIYCGAGVLDVSALVPAVAPAAPANVAVAGRDSALKISWTRPPTTGGGIIDYTATAYSAPAAGTVLGSCTAAALTCSVDGLSNGSNHYIEVVARNATGSGPANAPRVVGVPNALSSGLFSPLSPARLLDTRVTGPAIGPGVTRGLQVTGAGGVPASGVSAVVVNVTAVTPTANGYLTAYPSGTTRPGTSSLNFPAGRTVPNLVVVKVGTDGKINLYNNTGTTHALVDVAGWFTEAGGPVGSVYTALSPSRVLDTRVTGPAIGQGVTRGLQVTGAGGVPASGVSAVVVNVTAVTPTANGYLTAYPSGTTRPGTSSLNFPAGSTVPNLVVVKVGTDGKINLYNNTGTTHTLVDVAGYFTDVTSSPEVSVYTALSPSRVLDTRNTTSAIGPSSTRSVLVTGTGGVPPSGVTAVVVNVTAVTPTTNGYLTAYPSGTTRPGTSSLNFSAGRTVPNLAVVKVGADGKINLYNSAGTTHALVDIAGWFG